MEKFDKNTIKNIIIGILVLGIIGYFIFRPVDDTDVDKFKQEIERLNSENETLKTENEYLLDEDKRHDREINNYINTINDINNKLNIAYVKLNKLLDEKNKINPYVDAMDIDGVAREFTNYFERKQGQSNFIK